MSEKSLVKIREQPPPSSELGYELVYSNRTTYQGRDFNKKAAETEKMSLGDLLRTPGLNIIVASLGMGIIILLYLVYLLLK